MISLLTYLPRPASVSLSHLGTHCRLYHLDHWTLPDGPSTFLINDRPLIDNGGRIGTFYENRCKSEYCMLHGAASKTQQGSGEYYSC